MLNKTSCKYQT